MKKILTKAISALIALATMCSTSAFAGMVVDVPAETLETFTIPSDAAQVTATLNAVNGVDADGNPVTDEEGNQVKSNDLFGWAITYRHAQFTQITQNTSGYLVFGGWGTNGNGCNMTMTNNKVLTGLDKPFELNMDISWSSGGGRIYLGNVKSFGAAEDDYYLIQASMNNSFIRLQRVKEGETTITEEYTYASKPWSFTGSLKFDGKTTALCKKDGTVLCESSDMIPLTDGKIYYAPTGGMVTTLKTLELTRPSSTKSVDNYYARLHKDDIVAEDLTQTALSEAGWTASIDGAPEAASDYKNWIKFTGGTASIYSNNIFDGNYTLETKQRVQFNYVYTIFNYQDDDNYYALVNSQPSNYGNTKPISIIKRYNGKNYYIWVGSYTQNYWQWNDIKINVSTDGAATTINMVSPVECTIVDNGGEITTYKAVDTGEKDADDKAIYEKTTETVDLGAAFTSGKVGIKGASSGYIALHRLLVYPTDKAEESTLANISVDLSVDGVAVDGNEAPRGVTTVSMPKKYLGINNKILVALYENHVMSGLKIYEASDFYVNDSLEAFDTTNASEDAEIGVFMWNSLNSIKPIIAEKVYSVAE